MRRVAVWSAAALAMVGLLLGAHQWSEAQGEDAAPVWSCRTMGNGECAPDSPWHGVTIGRAS